MCNMWLCYENYAFEYSVTQIEKQRKYNEIAQHNKYCVLYCGLSLLCIMYRFWLMKNSEFSLSSVNFYHCKMCC